jgi:hypothetical protein
VLCILLHELSVHLAASLNELVFETAHDLPRQQSQEDPLAVGKSFRSLIDPLSSVLVHIHRANQAWVRMCCFFFIWLLFFIPFLCLRVWSHVCVVCLCLCFFVVSVSVCVCMCVYSPCSTTRLRMMHS